MVDNVARALATKAINFINYEAPPTDLYEGTATGGTQNTLVDTTANWTPNEFVDKVVRIKKMVGQIMNMVLFCLILITLLHLTII